MSPAAGAGFRVGRHAVAALSDGVLAPMPPVQPDVSVEELRDLFEPDAPDPADYEVPVNAYLVRSDERTVLIDAGGELPGFPTLGRMGAALRAIGVEPGDIDVLLLTHLHVDHIGGMIDAGGAPVFPDAEVVLTEAEHAFWHDEATMAAMPEEQRGLVTLARTAVAAYGDRVRRIAGDTQVLPDITAVPLPGHTPGHCGFLVADGSEQLLIWADAVQVQPLQFAHPELYVFEVDPERAIAARRAVMDRAAADGLTVAGMHLELPGFGHVVRRGDAFAFEPIG